MILRTREAGADKGENEWNVAADALKFDLGSERAGTAVYICV